MYIGYIFFKKH